MEVLAISFFVICIVCIIYIAVSSMIKISNMAYKRKEISKRSYQLMVTTSVVVGISIATTLPLDSIKLLGLLI